MVFDGLEHDRQTAKPDQVLENDEMKKLLCRMLRSQFSELIHLQNVTIEACWTCISLDVAWLDVTYATCASGAMMTVVPVPSCCKPQPRHTQCHFLQKWPVMTVIVVTSSSSSRRQSLFH